MFFGYEPSDFPEAGISRREAHNIPSRIMQISG